MKTQNKNLLVKLVADRYFEEWNQSIVVLANSKTVLNDKHADTDIKDKVIRADRLIRYMKQKYDMAVSAPFSKKETLEFAQVYLEYHKEVEHDYTAKYRQFRKGKHSAGSVNDKKKIESRTKGSDNSADIFNELKQFRLAMSKLESVPPYFICNDNQAKRFNIKMPRTKKELLHVNGFGEVKADKYGDGIIKIISKY